MEDSNGFIQAIVEDPHDTAVRLIFADWLQDHGGEAYAEFIRVQCELALLPECSFCADGGVWISSEDTSESAECHCRGTVLRRREAELLEHNWMAFAGEPVLRLVNFYKRKGAPVFHRGFVESIECTCEQWLKHGPLIVRRQPVLEVKLMGREPHGSEGVFAWFDDRRIHGIDRGPCYLPAVIHDRLRWSFDWTTDPPQSSLRNREEALVALSDACLAWARGPHPARGLEALPPLRHERETVAT